jgi:hypothetical protein
MGFAYWITKATGENSDYAILAFPVNYVCSKVSEYLAVRRKTLRVSLVQIDVTIAYASFAADALQHSRLHEYDIYRYLLGFDYA